MCRLTVELEVVLLGNNTSGGGQAVVALADEALQLAGGGCQQLGVEVQVCRLHDAALINGASGGHVDDQVQQVCKGNNLCKPTFQL